MSSRHYKLSNKEYKNLDGHLLYITESKYEQDWNSTPHSHHFTELFFVLQGKGTFKVADLNFPIYENDLIIVNSNLVHTELSDSNAPMHYIVLGVDHLEFQNNNNGYSLHNLSHVKDEIQFYFKSILHEARTKADNYEAICQNLFQILIYKLIRDVQTELLAVPSKKATPECYFVEQYLNEHFKEDISLQTLSELTYLNKYYLAHVFKNYKGISPINYLIQVRIKEAKHLLETTDYSIAKIASSIGFSSQSYFSQVFRKETNMTPNEYRKRNEKK